MHSGIYKNRVFFGGGGYFLLAICLALGIASQVVSSDNSNIFFCLFINLKKKVKGIAYQNNEIF